MGKINRDYVPPIFVKLYRRINAYKYIHFFNGYSSWEDAHQDALRIGEADAYESQNILEKVAESIQLVRSGEAMYEQDGVLFYKERNEYELLTSLFYMLSENMHLNICDFGGSLGSTFFRYKDKLPLERLKWNIVEQRNYVDYGKDNIPELDFFYSIEECVNTHGKIDAILLLSVLQFLDKPYEMIDKLLLQSPRYIVIDATPFNIEDEEDCIVLEHVPSSVYRAVYPSWIFNTRRFVNYFEKKGYVTAFEWAYPFGSLSKKTRFGFEPTQSKGFLFCKDKR